MRPRCDQERRSCAAACGPTPGWSSSWGCQLARERLDLGCELAFLGGQLQDASGDRAQRERAAREARDHLDRQVELPRAVSATVRGSAAAARCAAGSGVVISRSRSWQRAAHLALTAPSRAATSACSAWRSPPARGVAGRSWLTLRAARTASSASLFPPERRSLRSLPTSSTRSPRPVRKRVRPEPNEPAPSTANARRAAACAWTSSRARAYPSLFAATVASNTIAPLITLWRKSSHGRGHLRGDPRAEEAPFGLGKPVASEASSCQRVADDGDFRRGDAVETPETHYLHSGDVNIAYQVLGDGPSISSSFLGSISLLNSSGRCGPGPRSSAPCLVLAPDPAR